MDLSVPITYIFQYIATFDDSILKQKTPPAVILKTLLGYCAISGHPPFPVHSITGTLSESAFLFHACVLITLYSGMIQISGCAFPTGTALCFSRVFPTPPLSGISYARSVSGNNGFSMPDSSC